MGSRWLVFQNGSVFDRFQHRPGFGVVVADGRVAAVAPDGQLDRHLDAPTSSASAAVSSHPASRTPTPTRCRAG